jgi:ketosteroid isomerase-like protein
MSDQENRAALEKHWEASRAGDQDAEHEIYADDAVVDYPQSGERVHGRHNVQALRSQHPAKPSGFAVRRIVGGGDLWVTEYVIAYDGQRFDTVSIMEFQAGKVVHETQYFAEPFEPPAWRAHLVGRMT